MPKSIIEAIQMGLWEFEPDQVDGSQFESTEALPGTDEKLDIMARRVSEGKPLWHPADRLTMGE